MKNPSRVHFLLTGPLLIPFFSIYDGLLHDGFIPEVIIVGVTYAGDNPGYAALRSMDYTPVHDVFLKGSGDVHAFHAFLKEQLIPFREFDASGRSIHENIERTRLPRP